MDQGVLLLYENVSVHKKRIVQAAIHECKFDQQNNPPYCPDLAPSNYYLLKKLGFHLQGTRFP